MLAELTCGHVHDRGRSDRADDDRFVGDRPGWDDRPGSGQYHNYGPPGHFGGGGGPYHRNSYEDDGRESGGRGHGSFGHDQSGAFPTPHGGPPFRGSYGDMPPPPPPPPPRRPNATPADRFDPSGFEDRNLFPPPPPPKPATTRGGGTDAAIDDDDDPERRAFEAELRRVAADLERVSALWVDVECMNQYCWGKEVQHI